MLLIRDILNFTGETNTLIIIVRDEMKRLIIVSHHMILTARNIAEVVAEV